MKRIATIGLAALMLISVITTAFAYPAKPKQGGTWKDAAQSKYIGETIPAPSKWAEEAVYAALASGIHYNRTYNATKDELGPKFMDWTDSMTREHFAELMYYTIDEAVLAFETEHTSKYNAAFKHGNAGAVFVSDQITYFIRNWLVDVNSSEYYAGRGNYNEYEKTGGTLSEEEYAEYIGCYVGTENKPLKRYFEFNDNNNQYVDKVAKEGIISGTGNGNFSPYNTITRQQAATMMVRAFEKIGIPMKKSTKMYKDNSSIADYATEAVYKVASIKDDNGVPVMQGMSDGTFNPNGNLTYEQAMVMAVRMQYALRAYVKTNLK